MSEDSEMMLIRIDERQRAMAIELKTLIMSVDKIWAKMDSLSCDRNTEKIKILEKIVAGALIISLGAAVKSFF